MRLARFFLKAANFALSAAVFLSFLVIGAFSVFDTPSIYASARKAKLWGSSPFPGASPFAAKASNTVRHTT